MKTINTLVIFFNLFFYTIGVFVTSTLNGILGDNPSIATRDFFYFLFCIVTIYYLLYAFLTFKSAFDLWHGTVYLITYLLFMYSLSFIGTATDPSKDWSNLFMEFFRLFVLFLTPVFVFLYSLVYSFAGSEIDKLNNTVENKNNAI